MKMTFKEFQNSRELLSVEVYEMVYGVECAHSEHGIKNVFCYSDGLMIEVDMTNENNVWFHLQYERSDFSSSNIEELEQLLYNWAVTEGYLNS